MNNEEALVNIFSEKCGSEFLDSFKSFVNSKGIEETKNILMKDYILKKISATCIRESTAEDICEILGIDFALKLLELELCNLKKGAQEYFFDLFRDEYMTSELWKKLNKETKYYVTNKVLDYYSYDYDKLIRYIRRDIEHPRMEQENITIEPKLILPSAELTKLIVIVDSSGDEELKKYIESFIKAYSKNIIYPHYPPEKSTFYFLDKSEKELIRRAILIFKNNKYLMKSMPNILLSYEDPPFFILYPHLVEEKEEKSSNKEEKSSNKIDKVPRQKSEENTIFYDTELLLGIYKIYPQNHIVLYKKGLSWCAKKLKCSYEKLKWTVLVHEIGHWITHTFYKDNWEGWEDSRYLKTEENVHEGWAQLITYWVIKSLEKDNKKTHDELIKVFEDLNEEQSDPYKKFKEFINKDKSKVIDTLKGLRDKVDGAKFSEWLVS